MKLSSKLKKGDIIQLTQYSTIQACNGHTATVQPDDSDSPIEYRGILDKDYIKSADHYDKEVKATKTELEEIFKMNPRTVMTVTFYKQVKEKDVVDKLEALYANQGGHIISKEDYLKAVKAVAKEVTLGELRTARGRHELNYGTGGRLYFVDMDKEKNPEKDYDTRIIQVDPRTLQSIVVNNIKYVLK